MTAATVQVPALGVGAVYVPGIEPLLDMPDSPVQVLEIEPQTHWRFQANASQPYQADDAVFHALATLPQARLIHGVGFPVGGSRVPDMRHLPTLRHNIGQVGACWASEHLLFNQATQAGASFNTGFMLPPLLTWEGVEAAAATIRAIRQRLPVPFAVEVGVNYLRPRTGELSDGQFVAAVCEQADCGILLDLHNVWSNERNGRQSVEAFLGEIPLERVWEIHLAGGRELDGYWLDAHSGSIPPEVMRIATAIVPALPRLGAIIFEILPDYLPRFGLDGLRGEFAKMQSLWALRQPRPCPESTPAQGVAGISCQPAGRTPLSPRQWEDSLGTLLVYRQADTPLAQELAADPGIALIRKLVWRFRAGMIWSSLRLTCRLIILHKGQPYFDQLLDGYFAQYPPQAFAAQEVAGFAAYLRASCGQLAYVCNVLAYETANARVLTTGEAETVAFGHEPWAIITPLGQGLMPDAPPAGHYEIEITPE